MAFLVPGEFAHVRGFGSHAPAMNNFICVCIVKRDKRMREVVWGVTSVRGIRIRERTFSFSVHFRVRRGAVL
jgi:hypothetical protein